MSEPSPQDFTRDLIRWSEALAAIARTGIGFTESLYERERYEEILKVAADIKIAADEALEVRREQDHFVQEWMESVGEGVPGYVTPKVAIGAIVGNDAGEVLLVSQFTLHARTKKGTRPSFDRAARPEVAIPLYERFVTELSAGLGKSVATGEFGAMMKVALVNDGPVTILLDSRVRE